MKNIDSCYTCKMDYYCYACKMGHNYEALRVSDLRDLVIFHGLWGYSRMRKAKLIRLLRFHDVITRYQKNQNNSIQKNWITKML